MPFEYDEEGYPVDYSQWALSNIIRVVIKLGDAISVEEFDPMQAIVSVECPRPIVPSISKWEINTLGTEQPTDQ